MISTRSKPVKPDTAKITFRARIRAVNYGDDLTFHEWSIRMFHRGKLVGSTPETWRGHSCHLDARTAARREIRRLQKRRLFVIPVTARCIADGQERDCNTCAIAQALWHSQERMGYPKRDYNFRVSTYGAWMDCPGIVLSGEDAETLHIPPDKLPQVLTQGYAEDMADWTMGWDDWAESRHETAEEWRERTGEDDDEPKPCRPLPCTFVLDLDDFAPLGDDYD